MKVIQAVFNSPTETSDWHCFSSIDPRLILVFASPEFFRSTALVDSLRNTFPSATLAGCSTAGEITSDSVNEGSCVVTAIQFDDTVVRLAKTSMQGMESSRIVGKTLGEALNAPDLKSVILLGQGLDINGSALVEGVVSVLGTRVPVTGGLAGDNGAFSETWVISNDGVSSRDVVAVGLYGSRLEVKFGSYGGWEPFGPARKVTRCQGNILFELDGEPALDIYKRYLGDYAKDLPASGLLFPFAMLGKDQDQSGIIRTILGVDEAAGSLTLAGEIEAAGYLQLMHASTDKLVDGAETAARTLDPAVGAGQGFALLVSCVGRKLVMGPRVDEEIEAVADHLGRGIHLAGFYSYGEICPFGPFMECKLHNQTMTISRFIEG